MILFGIESSYSSPWRVPLIQPGQAAPGFCQASSDGMRQMLRCSRFADPIREDHFTGQAEGLSSQASDQLMFKDLQNSNA